MHRVSICACFPPRINNRAWVVTGGPIQRERADRRQKMPTARTGTRYDHYISIAFSHWYHVKLANHHHYGLVPTKQKKTSIIWSSLVTVYGVLVPLEGIWLSDRLSTQSTLRVFDQSLMVDNCWRGGQARGSSFESLSNQRERGGVTLLNE